MLVRLAWINVVVSKPVLTSSTTFMRFERVHGFDVEDFEHFEEGDR